VYIRDNIFLISCAARTGSTYLVHLLRSHPDLFCHGEVFGGEKVNGLLGEYGPKLRKSQEIVDHLSDLRRCSPELFMYKYVLDTQGFKSVGFKYKTDEAMREAYAPLTKIVSSDMDLKIIFLLRKNILAQYISHEIVLKQTGVTLAINDCDLPAINKIKLDLDECVSYIESVKERQKRAEKIYQGHRVFYVYYEDMIDNSAQKSVTHKELQEFLSVRVVELSSPTKKIIREPLEDLVTNYSAICEGLIEKGFGKYINE